LEKIYNVNVNGTVFPGKIAVITMPPTVNEDDFHSVDRLTAKYGTEKIIHVTWPEDFISEKDKMIDTAAKLAADKDIRVLIVSQAVPGTNAAVDKLKETRNDVFIIYSMIQEPAVDASLHANIVFTRNQLGMGAAMVKQAKKQGAKVFVHYSFPRHLAIALLIKRRDMIRETCAAEGITFVERTAPDPTGDGGLEDTHKFILEDVPKLVEKYGEDTAFFSTNCQMQIPLIRAVVDSHAIYPQPCCPSPFHGFPEALGIITDGRSTDLNYVISEASRIAAEKNMTDRLSTWPVSASMMFTNAGAEYAIKWINGKVPGESVDDRILEDCMSSYIKEVVGEGVEVEMVSYSENDVTYDNFKLILMSYLDF